MDARLVMLSGSLAGRTIALQPGVTRIGRRAECQIRFADSDTGVSGSHATIRIEGTRVMLEDAASRNGTYVAGARITSCELAPGQIIAFGSNGPTARFEQTVPAVVSASPASVPAPVPLPPPISPPLPAPVAAVPVPSMSPHSPHAAHGSGLTMLYHAARQKVVADTGNPQPGQTAVVKAFVQLAQQRSNRRVGWIVGGITVLAVGAVAAVYIIGTRQTQTLQDQLTMEGKARAAVEAKMASLAEATAASQRTTEEMGRQLASAREEAQRQREAVEKDEPLRADGDVTIRRRCRPPRSEERLVERGRRLAANARHVRRQACLLDVGRRSGRVGVEWVVHRLPRLRGWMARHQSPLRRRGL
ncbi:MAG: FHA domain-containing protein [Vicinamibacterales bacterium]